MDRATNGRGGSELAKPQTRRWASFCVWILLVGACASTEIADLNSFEMIPMNRVVPFPSESERSDRAFEVGIVEGTVSGKIDETLLEGSGLRVAQELRKLAVSAGARVLTQSDALIQEIAGGSDPEHTADYELLVDFSVFQDVTNWKPPFRFLWQSPDEVAGQPGTCTHRAEVEFDVRVVEPTRGDRTLETYSLRHNAELEIDGLDPTCPLDPEPRHALFDTALLESLSCLRAPLDRLLAPRGHILAHRRARDSDGDLYEISIGASQGVERGEAVEVRREQHASTPSGEAWRTERVIAEGVVTDQVRPETAWVAIDAGFVKEEILEGDVVRPVVSQGLLSSLSGPNCKVILEIR